MKVSNHPELDANLDLYEKLDDWRDGTKFRIDKYIRRYSTESSTAKGGNEAYAGRVERSDPEPFCGPYCDLHVAHLAQNFTINGFEGDTADEIRADVTGYGMSDSKMFRELLSHYCQDGRVGVLVDRAKDVALTAGEAAANGERSYQVLYRAANIRNWEYFESGANKGKLKDLYLDEPDYVDEAGKHYKQIRRFVLEGPLYRWELLRSEGVVNDVAKAAEYQIVDAGDGALPEIPFVIFGNGPNESYIKHLWEGECGLYNQNSILNNVNYNQGCQRLYASGVADGEVAKMGEDLISIFGNPDASIGVVPAGTADAIFKRCEVLRSQNHRRGKFEFNQLADDTRQTQSAESKALDQTYRTALYDTTLDLFADKLTHVYKLHAMFEGMSPDGIEISIEREYGLEDETAKAVTLQAVFAMAGALGIKPVQKEVLKSYLSGVEFIPGKDESVDDVLKRLVEAIDNAEDTPQSLASFVSGQPQAKPPQIGAQTQPGNLQ